MGTRADHEENGSRSSRGMASVIIVAADSGALLSRCVAHVLASDTALELIVVDNASTDGQPQRLVEQYGADGRLRLVRNESNRGFGPACNQGAALARGDALVFLNPDCLIAPQVIGSLDARLREHPHVGILGVCIVDEHGQPTVAMRRREPTLARAVAHFSGLAGSSCWQGVNMDAPASVQGIEPVDVVSGALLAMPRGVFERLQGFDEGYFLHCEDFDLCRRTRDLGREVAIDHDLIVEHRQGSSSHHRPVFVAWHKHRGMARYFHKFDPAARNPLLRVLVGIGVWAHFGLTLPALLLRRRQARRAAP